MARLKVGVLISGRGSNLQALIDACADPAFPAEVVLVLSNKPGAYGLERAKAAGIPALALPHKDFADRPSFEAAMDSALREHGAEFVCLAGFMRLLTPWFIERWLDRLINIHPSLLPAFKGLDTHRRAIEAGVRFTGCSVHFVRAEMDDGPIIVQAAVPVMPGDDEEALSSRVLEAEHRCYPLALRLAAEGRLTVTDGRVEISGIQPRPDSLLNPPD